MKIKITSDSTCDLSPELLRENDIELFPLFINKGDESFRDGVDIQPADIFAHVAAGGALCSTAAVPVGVFHDRFAELAKEYDAVFHVNIGSGFSASHQNAVLAAEDLPNVYVIDSRNLSTGQVRAMLCSRPAALQRPPRTLRRCTGSSMRLPQRSTPASCSTGWITWSRAAAARRSWLSVRTCCA